MRGTRKSLALKVRWVGQAIDETNQIGTTIVVRGAQPRYFQFAHSQETVVAHFSEINHLGLGMPQDALEIVIAHRHTIADQTVESLIVLEQGT